MDLIWMLQSVPVGTPHSLPALGSPNPWYILPSIYSTMPAPWDRAPNKETLRLEQIHQEAAKTARVLAQAQAEAKEPRDPAAAKAEQNRKKKERKLRAKARKEAEEAEAAARGADEDETQEDADVAPKEDAEAAPTSTKPTVAYALPSYLDDQMQEEFLKHYATLHADFEERRKDEAVVTLPPKFQKAPMGNCYMYPREHPDDPQRGVTWDKESMTLLYHTE
ncbi:sperm nuclear basic protein PL-I isoform PLIb [Rhodotorula sp. JG-1b]|nr:sperm nuclear basic protein PL-I isoform PLIb [Rhodotorula sp. JG-1b]